MPSLEYSLEAQNVKSAFFRAKALVYVEGDDDVLFWEAIFALTPNFPVEIEPVGGSAQLDKHIENITNGRLNAIAARDSDFLAHTKNSVCSPRVLYTYGYSIENSLYTEDILHQILRSFCRSASIPRSKSSDWLNLLGSSFAPLICLDIANAISKSGQTVISDSCSRFMTSGCSATPCAQKIADHASSIETLLPPSAITSGKLAVSGPATAIKNLKGHTLASAALKFIIKSAKSVNRSAVISRDSLYVSAIAFFSGSIGTSHPHRGHYSRAANLAAESFL